MTAEYRFVLADFRCIGPGGAPRLYEAGRSYPMAPAVTHAAAKRGLVAKAKPPAWTSPSFGRRAEVLTEMDIPGRCTLTVPICPIYLVRLVSFRLGLPDI